MNVVTGDPFSTYLLGYNMDGSYGEFLAKWANQRALGEPVDLHMNPSLEAVITYDTHHPGRTGGQ